MIKQIISTIVIIFSICVYVSLADKEELSGNSTVLNEQYFEGQKAGKIKKLNTIKWILNKNYRRGYIWGSNNEEI